MAISICPSPMPLKSLSRPRAGRLMGKKWLIYITVKGDVE